MLFIPGFFKGVLGTRFGSLEFQIGSLESEKIIIGPLKSEKIGSLELEKSDPYSPCRVSLKKTVYTLLLFKIITEDIESEMGWYLLVHQNLIYLSLMPLKITQYTCRFVFKKLDEYKHYLSLFWRVA